MVIGDLNVTEKKIAQGLLDLFNPWIAIFLSLALFSATLILGAFKEISHNEKLFKIGQTCDRILKIIERPSSPPAPAPVSSEDTRQLDEPLSSPTELSPVSSEDETDEKIIERISPKVSLIIGLLLGISGNLFVSALFLGFSTETMGIGTKFTIFCLGIMIALYCILLLFDDVYPDLSRIKNYPQQTHRRKWFSRIFIVIFVIITICGILGVFGPTVVEKIPLESCQNVTYITNEYNQNYTIEQIRIEKSYSSFSIQELGSLMNNQIKS